VSLGVGRGSYVILPEGSLEQTPRRTNISWEPIAVWLGLSLFRVSMKLWVIPMTTVGRGSSWCSSTSAAKSQASQELISNHDTYMIRCETSRRPSDLRDGPIMNGVNGNVNIRVCCNDLRPVESLRACSVNIGPVSPE